MGVGLIPSWFPLQVSPGSDLLITKDPVSSKETWHLKFTCPKHNMLTFCNSLETDYIYNIPSYRLSFN